MVVDIFATNEKYGIIYTDPPWAQNKGNLRKCRPKQDKQLDYPTMSLQDIEDLHKRAFERIADTRHNVFMWTIDKFLHQTEEMMHRLGYELHARMVWNKENGVAPAFTVRYTHEYLLWFYPKGKMLKPAPEQRGKYTTVFSEAATKHSKKPICTYEMLQAMFPQINKIELFARNYADGWDCWGNEVDL